MGLRPPMVNLLHDSWVKPTNGGRRPIVGVLGGVKHPHSKSSHFCLLDKVVLSFAILTHNNKTLICLQPYVFKGE